MSYDLSKFPISNATDPDYLFRQLGYFWQKMFKDKKAVQGLTQAQASGANQAYTDILDVVACYSGQDLPIYNKINWYPLIVKRSDINNQSLLLGEGVKFGDLVSGDPYIVGEAPPTDADVYTMLAPAGLEEVSIIADHILVPSAVWVSGSGVKLQNRRISFFENPFDQVEASSIIPLYLSNGERATYMDFTTHMVTDDSFITLWCYNVKIDAENLNNNIAYLFGLHLSSSEANKTILNCMLDVMSKGPSIHNIEKLCRSIIGNPTDTDNNVKVLDNISYRAWWQSQFTAGPGSGDLPLVLPPHIFLTDYRGMIRFDNASEPVWLDGTDILLPIQASETDKRKFNTVVNQTTALHDLLVEYLDPTALTNGVMINPADFVFSTMLSNSTTLIHVKFTSLDQLQLFEVVFKSLQDSLPKHVMLMFLCDIQIANEVYNFSTSSITDTTDLIRLVFPTTLADNVFSNFQDSLGPGVLVQDMVASRTIPTGANTMDFSNISFTTIPA